MRSGRVRVLVHRAWRRLTWWRWPVSKVSAVDAVAGRITLVALRWSWRRWRWEPMPRDDDFLLRGTGEAIAAMEPMRDIGHPEADPLVPHRGWWRHGGPSKALDK